MPTPTVCISYSHRDQIWLDRLVRHLKVLEREGLLDVWDDRRIGAGEAWRTEIESVIEKARIAVLLVSADFLTSDFVRDKEVPRLLERRAAEGLIVIPLIVWPCDWQAVPWLAAIQARPRDGRALSSGNDYRSEEDLAALAMEIRQLLADVEKVGNPDASSVEVSLRKWKPPNFPDEPYPLLLPYEHPELFAGRERDLERLRQLIKHRIPILGLYAPSGSGKSSILAAGLVPALRAEGRAVAFDRHPQESGLGQRLISNLLVGPAGDRPQGADDPRHFVDYLAAARRLSGEPSILVIDQFEDVLLRERVRERAVLGILLASTVAEQVALDEPFCRWLLAYREEFHGKVTTWLEDVLRDARRVGAEIDDLPHNLLGLDRFQPWALPMLGAPRPGDDSAEEAVQAFGAAIDAPLALMGDHGIPRYPWKFSTDGAQRLASAFAEARLERPDAPLVPELQVVLAHLLETAEASRGSREGVVEINVPEDPGQLISEAIADHLRKVLKSAFRTGSETAARRGRTRALLALRELAETYQRSGEGIGASLLAAAIGEEGNAILSRLEAPNARLIMAREDIDDPTGKSYVLSHDRLGDAVFHAVEQEDVKLEMDRELLGLRRLVAFNVGLYSSGYTRHSTRLDRKQFHGVRKHAQVLLWDNRRQEWWRECQKRRNTSRQRWATWGVVAAIFLMLIGSASWRRLENWRQLENRMTMVDELTELLVAMIGSSAPSQPSIDKVTATATLERGALRIESKLQNQPLIRATMMHSIGTIYMKLGTYDKARRFLESALEIRREVHGDTDIEVVESLKAVAEVLTETAELDRAEELIREALELRREVKSDKPPCVADCMAQLGQILLLKGQLDSAEAIHREALRLLRERSGKESCTTTIADSLYGLTAVLNTKGDFAGSEEIYRELLQEQISSLGRRHPDVVLTMNNLALTLVSTGDGLDEAEDLYEEALETSREILGPNHPDTAVMANNLAHLLRKRGKYSEAERLFKESLSMFEQGLGENHPNTAFTKYSLARLYRSMGDPDEARRWLAEALAIYRKVLGEDHPEIAVIMADMKDILESAD